MSQRFKDRPKTPKEEIIYWTEYVIKHKGAHHLKSAGLGLPWYKLLLIDVIFFVVAIVLAGLSIVYFTFKTVKHQICSLISKKRNKVD